MTKKEARVIHLQKTLLELQMFQSLLALNMMIELMNSYNGYKRRDGSHYYYHLVDSAQDLLNHGVRDEITITACILHDSVEDIEQIELEHITAIYGAEVASVVYKVTKNPDIDYKDAEFKNTKEYLTIILSDWRACLVKASDRKHNFSTLDSTSAKHEERQMLETEAVYIPFLKEARKLYPEYSSYFHSTKTTIMPHLKRIKKSIKIERELKEQNEKLKTMLQEEREKNKKLSGKLHNARTMLKGEEV